MCTLFKIRQMRTTFEQDVMWHADRFKLYKPREKQMTAPNPKQDLQTPMTTTTKDKIQEKIRNQNKAPLQDIRPVKRRLGCALKNISRKPESPAWRSKEKSKPTTDTNNENPNFRNIRNHEKETDAQDLCHQHYHLIDPHTSPAPEILHLSILFRTRSSYSPQLSLYRESIFRESRSLSP